MADNDNIERKEIIISVDKSAADASLKAIKSLEKETENLGKGLKSLGKQTGDYAGELRKAIKEDNAAASSISKLTTELKEQGVEGKKTVGIIESLTSKYKELKSGSSGGIGGNVSDIRGSISTVTGGAADQALSVAGGVGDAVEAFGSLNPAIIASTLAIGALSLVMSKYTQEAEKQADAINSAIDAQRSVGQAVAGGLTSADATSRLEELNRLRTEEQALLEKQKSAYQEAMDSLGALGLVAQQIAPQEQALADQIATSEANIASYTSEINGLNTRLADGSISANDTAKAEEELARTREADSQKAIQQTESANQRILALNEQRDSLLENRAIAESNANQSLALEQKFAYQDEKTELKKHLADLGSIRESGQAKELAIAKQLGDLPNQQAQDLAKVTSKGTTELSKLNSDYYADTIKATQDFAKESNKINQEVAKNAKRIAEDLADTLSDAARDNDVVAFLEAQRNGQKELKRNAEDAKGAEKERQEDFLAAQEEQKQAFEQRQAEILAQAAQEKAQVLQSYAEKRKALEQQMAQERANTQEALQNAKMRYEQEEQQEDIQASRNAQRLALRETQENAAFARTLAQIDAKTQAELAGLAKIQAAASSLSVSGGAKPTYNSPNVTGYGSFGNPSYKSPYDKIPTASNPVMNTTVVVGDIATASQVTNAINQNNQNMMSAWLKGTAKAQG